MMFCMYQTVFPKGVSLTYGGGSVSFHITRMSGHVAFYQMKPIDQMSVHSLEEAIK